MCLKPFLESTSMIKIGLQVRLVNLNNTYKHTSIDKPHNYLI